MMLVFLLAGVAEAQQKGLERLDCSNPIKIGYLNAFTGTAAMITSQNVCGLNEAVEEINAAGGILGRPLKVITRDDKLDPEIGLREGKDLVLNERVFWIQGVT